MTFNSRYILPTQQCVQCTTSKLNLVCTVSTHKADITVQTHCKEPHHAGRREFQGDGWEYIYNQKIIFSLEKTLSLILACRGRFLYAQNPVTPLPRPLLTRCILHWSTQQSGLVRKLPWLVTKVEQWREEQVMGEALKIQDLVQHQTYLSPFSAERPQLWYPDSNYIKIHFLGATKSV